MALSERQQKDCKHHDFDFSDLSALILNCTLKPSSKMSHTDGLLDVPRAILKANGVSVKSSRPVDLNLAPGVQPDMREEGFDEDDWPVLCKEVMAADILIIGTPIWLGEESSVCRRLIERLYAQSGKLNERGQYVYYGRVGGCVITGNEDGIKHVAMSILYALQHIGYTIPPQADAGWVGAAGPGPSYADENSGGPENEFTQRNTTFMTWNLMHLARILKELGGFPAHGNLRSQWDAGCDLHHPNPDYR